MFSPAGLIVLGWCGEDCNTSMIRSYRSIAGVPSTRKPASEDKTSDSVELCETAVCFLHIQLLGMNVRLPKTHRTPPEDDFASFRSGATSESWNDLNLHCSAVFPT